MLKGEELAKLEVYKESLAILKISNNKITNITDLDCLKSFINLVKLDLESNEICKLPDYRTKVLAALPQLQALDGKDLDGQSVYTEDDEEEFGLSGDEGGEMDLEDEYNKVLEMLTPEQRKRFESGTMPVEEMKELGLINLNDYGEEGEDEQDNLGEFGEAGSESAYGDDDDEDEAANKKQKKD